MLPLLTTLQIREADAYTIAHEPVASIDLMERASLAFVNAFIPRFPDQAASITIFCGTGNNGGDGLAIARLLSQHGYERLSVIVARFSDKSTPDFDANLKRANEAGLKVKEIKPDDDFESIRGDIFIVALLGTGLNKPLDGGLKRLVDFINAQNKTTVAVDVPAGLFSDGEMPKGATTLRSDLVITFRQPKINFLLPESGAHIKKWEAVEIGLDEHFIHSLKSPYQAIQEDDISQMLRPRHRFSNKGTYGHTLIVAGQPETMGAALLCSSACVFAGSGLTTACVPQSGLTALNSYMPEVMAVVREGGRIPPINYSAYSALAVGPGLGKDDAALALFCDVLSNYKKPMVLDADGLNLLSAHPQLWKSVPPNSILTPHMKEFDRLFGQHENWWQRIQTGIQKAKEHHVYILLKNDYTINITPGGKVYFNTSSNPAMASGGMGDILTGIIAAFLAQGYLSEDAAILAAWLHGKAGDELALPAKLNVVLPSQVAAKIPAIMAGLMA